MTWRPCIRCAPSATIPWPRRSTRRLHGFLPFKHVDHLHPDWGIALAASANGKARMEEFNREFGRRLVWLPWQRPGFELAMMMKRAVQENPGCDGIVLGGHGLFTWGETQRECYLNSLNVIDGIGQFIERHGRGKVRFGGQAVPARARSQRIGNGDRSIFAGAHQRAATNHLQFQRRRGRARVCGLGSRERAGFSGHQLPRPLYPHQDPADVCALGRGRRSGRAEKTDRPLACRVPRSVPRLLCARLPRRSRLRCATPAPRWC